MEQRTALTKQKRFLWRKFRWFGFIALLLSAGGISALLFWERFSHFLWLAPFMTSPFWGLLALAVTYWLWLHRKPNLVQQLGSRNEAKRQQAFEQLLAMGEKAIPIFVQTLATPAGSSGLFGNWEGNEAHLLAVEGLGRLKAKGAIPVLIESLEHPSADVRAKAAWALGEIGDKQVIPYLIPLLGDTDITVKNVPRIPGFITEFGAVADWASEVLTKLGESGLVEAFGKALRQQLNEATRQRLQGTYRQEVAKALTEALDSPLPHIAAGAAWALGELKMMEALPKLERKARSPLTEGWVREKCQEAIAKLKPLSALPRPATSPSLDTGTLPRPAVPSQISVNTLPSPAEPPKDDKSD